MRKSALIVVMERAVRKAGRGLVHDLGEVEQLQVSRKGPADFVSKADVKAEQTIREELSRARPDFGFIQEEGGRIEAKDGDSYWIVDPLDGTTNFLHGIPHFAISVGLVQKGDVQAGMVYAPATDEMFYAEKGKGAFVNDKRLRVSGRTRMADALLATGIPFMGKPGHDTNRNELKALTDHVSGIRRFGVASLDMAWVAAGRFDGFWERGLKQWDIAAGIILVREAGGLVTDITGGRKMMETGNIIAANNSLHAPLLKTLKAASATT